MKTIKFQQDLISTLAKGKIMRIVILKNQSSVDFLMDAYLIRVPSHELWIDVEKIMHLFSSGLDIAKIYDEKSYSTAKLTDKLIIRGKNKLVELQGVDGTIALVDRRLLKYFESPSFLMKNSTSPIGVYEDGVFVGLVAPCSIPQEVY